MHFYVLAVCLARPLFTFALSYSLHQDLTSDGNFWDKFDFFDSAQSCKTPDGTGASCWDPTEGDVVYLNQQDAQTNSLIDKQPAPSGSGFQYTIRADNRPGQSLQDIPSLSGRKGRKSVRIQRKESHDVGTLIVLDLAHMPGGQCGTWPAFWSYSPQTGWPRGGEIDIIEGINDMSYNEMTMHTLNVSKLATTDLAQARKENCSMGGRYSPSDAANLAAADPTCWEHDNSGCGLNATALDTFGEGFNKAGGGIYVLELDGISGRSVPGPGGSGQKYNTGARNGDASGINIWFFSHDNAPANLKGGGPLDPSQWSTLPLASWPSNPNSCSVPDVFYKQQLIFNIAFCGQWAGSGPAQNGVGHGWVPGQACYENNGGASTSCSAYVTNDANSHVYDDTYFLINSLLIYTNTATGGPASPATSSGTSPTSASTSSAPVTSATAVSVGAAALPSSSDSNPAGGSTSSSQGQQSTHSTSAQPSNSGAAAGSTLSAASTSTQWSTVYSTSITLEEAQHSPSNGNGPVGAPSGAPFHLPPVQQARPGWDQWQEGGSSEWTPPNAAAGKRDTDPKRNHGLSHAARGAQRHR